MDASVVTDTEAAATTLRTHQDRVAADDTCKADLAAAASRRDALVARRTELASGAALADVDEDMARANAGRDAVARKVAAADAAVAALSLEAVEAVRHGRHSYRYRGDKLDALLRRARLAPATTTGNAAVAPPPLPAAGDADSGSGSGRGSGAAGAGAGAGTGAGAVAHQPFTWVLVDTAEGLTAAVKDLSGYAEVAFDCEGVALSRTGALTVATLLALDPADGSTTSCAAAAYIIDVHTLGARVFAAAAGPLLSGSRVLKVTFDCRSDSDALQHQFGVSLGHVLDVQVGVGVQGVGV